MICIIIHNDLSCQPHPACYQPVAGLAVPPTEAIHLKTYVLKLRLTLLSAMVPAAINPQKGSFGDIPKWSTLPPCLGIAS